MRPAALFLLTGLSLSCGGQVETPPPQAADAAPAPPSPVRVQVGRAVYLTPDCTAFPAGVAKPPVDVVVTLEYRRDVVARAFDGSRPSVASRYFVRDPHAPDGCAARELEPGLALFAEEASP